MRSRIFLLCVLLFLLALALLLRSDREPALESALNPSPRASTPAEHEPEAERASRSSVQPTPAEAREELQASASLARVRAALSAVSIDGWPPSNNLRDFTELDLSALRTAVLCNRIRAEELVELLDSGTCTAREQPVLLAALAFVPELPARARERILESVRDGSRAALGYDGSASSSRSLCSCYAALFALRMKSASEHVDRAAAQLLQLYPAPKTQDWAARDLATFALAGVGSSAAPETVQQIRELTQRTPELLLTSAAYQARCRVGAPGEAEAVLLEAEQGNGHAREGLERVTDAALLPTLEALATSKDPARHPSVPAQYLAASAARGLLSIASPDGASTFERLALSADPATSAAAERALALDPPIAAAAALARIAARARSGAEPHSIAASLESALERMRSRLARMTVPNVEREPCAAALRESLPRMLGQRQGFRAGLEIFALAASDADKPVLWRLLEAPELTPEDRQAIRAAWRLAHPLE
jgi:hypothetical protein